MLARLKVVNFRCLALLDLALGREQLLMGRNGMGKSAVFDAIERVAALVASERSVSELFPTTSCTRWSADSEQQFECDFESVGGKFRYSFAVTHDPVRLRNRLSRESLSFDDRPVFERRDGTGRVYSEEGRPGPELLVDPARSSVTALADSSANPRVTQFRHRISRLLVIRPDPRRHSADEEFPEELPSPDLSNFASWYRHLLQEKSGSVYALQNELSESLDGFLALRLATDGRQRVITEWRAPGREGARAEYLFEELSDGQRLLIALTTVLFWLGDDPATLCLDEPDNFLALTEIQPLLGILRLRPNVQFLAISHHPEVIDDLARQNGLVFDRPECGNVRVRKFAAPADTELTAAELVVRGDVEGHDG